MKSSVEIDTPTGSADGGGGVAGQTGPALDGKAPRPRANSYNFTPLRDIARAAGAPCPIATLPTIPFDRARTLFFRLRDRMRAFHTATNDFDGDELLAIKEALGQVYVDVSTKLAPDDFARDLRKLRGTAECAACARRDACPAAWEPVRADLFTRDDARVREILASLTGRVLDVGGGEATYLAPLADRAARGVIEYTCVDPDEVRLAVLGARYPFARFVAGTAEDLDEGLGLFDHVLFLRSYNHLVDPARALARALALLRPGGTLLLVDNVAFGLVRTAAHAARAEAAPTNLLEHHRNDGAAEAARAVASILSPPRADGRALDLVERRDIGPETSNQWLLRYACVSRGRAQA
ncbi:MAG: class I SAM-dependent methyltransferase [Minicystis sp.]